MTVTTQGGRAEVALRQQVEIFAGGGVSLDSLWRASGCPRGREPQSWARQAESLLSGLADYLASVGQGGPVVWTWEQVSSEPWRSGDLMASAWVGAIYATFLDGDGSVARRHPRPEGPQAAP